MVISNPIAKSVTSGDACLLIIFEDFSTSITNVILYLSYLNDQSNYFDKILLTVGSSKLNTTYDIYIDGNYPYYYLLSNLSNNSRYQLLISSSTDNGKTYNTQTDINTENAFYIPFSSFVNINFDIFYENKYLFILSNNIPFSIGTINLNYTSNNSTTTITKKAITDYTIQYNSNYYTNICFSIDPTYNFSINYLNFITYSNSDNYYYSNAIINTSTTYSYTTTILSTSSIQLTFNSIDTLSLKTIQIAGLPIDFSYYSTNNLLPIIPYFIYTPTVGNGSTYDISTSGSGPYTYDITNLNSAYDYYLQVSYTEKNVQNGFTASSSTNYTYNNIYFPANNNPINTYSSSKPQPTPTPTPTTIIPPIQPNYIDQIGITNGYTWWSYLNEYIQYNNDIPNIMQPSALTITPGNNTITVSFNIASTNWNYIIPPKDLAITNFVAAFNIVSSLSGVFGVASESKEVKTEIKLFEITAENGSKIIVDTQEAFRYSAAIESIAVNSGGSAIDVMENVLNSLGFQTSNINSSCYTFILFELDNLTNLTGQQVLIPLNYISKDNWKVSGNGDFYFDAWGYGEVSEYFSGKTFQSAVYDIIKNATYDDTTGTISYTFENLDNGSTYNLHWCCTIAALWNPTDYSADYEGLAAFDQGSNAARCLQSELDYSIFGPYFYNTGYSDKTFQSILTFDPLSLFESTLIGGADPGNYTKNTSNQAKTFKNHFLSGNDNPFDQGPDISGWPFQQNTNVWTQTHTIGSIIPYGTIVFPTTTIISVSSQGDGSVSLIFSTGTNSCGFSINYYIYVSDYNISYSVPSLLNNSSFTDNNVYIYGLTPGNTYTSLKIIPSVYIQETGITITGTPIIYSNSFTIYEYPIAPFNIEFTNITEGVILTFDYISSSYKNTTGFTVYYYIYTYENASSTIVNTIDTQYSTPTFSIHNGSSYTSNTVTIQNLKVSYSYYFTITPYIVIDGSIYINNSFTSTSQLNYSYAYISNNNYTINFNDSLAYTSNYYYAISWINEYSSTSSFTNNVGYNINSYNILITNVINSKTEIILSTNITYNYYNYNTYISKLGLSYNYLMILQITKNSNITFSDQSTILNIPGVTYITSSTPPYTCLLDFSSIYNSLYGKTIRIYITGNYKDGGNNILSTVPNENNYTGTNTSKYVRSITTPNGTFINYFEFTLT